MQFPTSPSRPAHRHPPGSPFNRPEPAEIPLEEYTVTDRVTHDRYGLGTVVNVADPRTVTVDFGDRTIRISLPNAKLSRL
jgi:hypothetical protein